MDKTCSLLFYVLLDRVRHLYLYLIYSSSITLIFMVSDIRVILIKLESIKKKK